jgi:hypothetical protein
MALLKRGCAVERRDEAGGQSGTEFLVSDASSARSRRCVNGAGRPRRSGDDPTISFRLPSTSGTADGDTGLPTQAVFALSWDVPQQTSQVVVQHRAQERNFPHGPVTRRRVGHLAQSVRADSAAHRTGMRHCRLLGPELRIPALQQL